MSLELEHVLACLSRAEEFDVVHDHSGLLAVTLAASVETPFVHTTHGHARPFGVLREALAFNPAVSLISLTNAQRRAAPHLPWIATCPNGIEVDRFPFRAGTTGTSRSSGACPRRGAAEAIAIARAAGLELRIAAKCREPAERAYFSSRVEPYLGDGIEYVGELDHEEKGVFLRDARALLAPIAWEEPFGLVFAEAAACGTPVVATRRGSVPESWSTASRASTGTHPRSSSRRSRWSTRSTRTRSGVTASARSVTSGWSRTISRPTRWPSASTSRSP